MQDLPEYMFVPRFIFPVLYWALETSFFQKEAQDRSIIHRGFDTAGRGEKCLWPSRDVQFWFMKRQNWCQLGKWFIFSRGYIEMFSGISFGDNENGKNKCALVHFIWDGIKDCSNVLDTPWTYEQKWWIAKSESDANTRSVRMIWVPGREFPIPFILLHTSICGDCQTEKK